MTSTENVVRLGCWGLEVPNENVVQLLSHVRIVTPWSEALQWRIVSFTIFRSLLRFMSIESVLLPNHLILCHPLLLLPLIFPSIRVFSNGLALRIRGPKYWCFSISPSSEYSGLKSGLFLQSKGLSRIFLFTTLVQKSAVAQEHIFPA